MRLLLTVILSVVLSCFASLESQAKNLKEINVGTVEFVPYFYKKDNEFHGPIMVKLNKIARKAGYKTVYHACPMKRLVELNKMGELDVIVLMKTVFNQNEVIPSDNMLCQIELRTYSIGDKDKIAKAEDLSGKRVGIFRGFSYGKWLNFMKDPNNNVDYYEVSTHKQLFKMLELGRIDYVLDYKSPAEFVLENMTIEDLNYQTVTVLPVYFQTSKTSKHVNAKKLIAELNKSYSYFLDSEKMTIAD